MVGSAALACGGDDDVTGAESEPVASITLLPSTATITPGGRLQLQAFEGGAGTSLTAHEISWSSSDEQVARVSGSGLVTGVSNGVTVITASSDGKSGSASIRVRTPPVESIELVPAAAEIGISETLDLVAITRDKDGNVVAGPEISWSSSDNQVATISQTGIVTGVAAGTAKITAMVEGEKGWALITVTPAE
jgi:uncharacterized protein YjdB